jgi:hypothetical protein
VKASISAEVNGRTAPRRGKATTEAMGRRENARQKKDNMKESLEENEKYTI